MRALRVRRGMAQWKPYARLIAAGMSIAGTFAGCKDVAGNQTLPAGTSDPASYNTVAGALGQRNATVDAFGKTWVSALLMTGLFSDEFQTLSCGINCDGLDIDRRTLAASTPNVTIAHLPDPLYNNLNIVRGLASQAFGALVTYAPNTSPALRGEMLALSGYAEVMLADLFCSGIPLSTVDYERDFTYAAPSTTAEVYQAAVAKFDSALAISSDSSRIMNLAQVGKGRALLALGQYAEAAQAVANVPTAFKYQVPAKWIDPSSGNHIIGPAQEGDSEGVNGLPFVSGGDPRSASQIVTEANGNGDRVKHEPTKIIGFMNGAGYFPLTVADGIEARLIEAEASLNANANGGQWLAILNTLRTAGGVSVPSMTLVDTLGVTGCGPGILCGTSPGGSDSSFGQPAGGFPGYTLVSADTVYPAPAGIQDYCNNHSWYEPCYSGDTMVVQTYASAAHIQWSAGTGGIPGLAELSDPGASLSGQAATDARIDLLFHERAEWLFVTAHRQGDLRRLIRQYHRPQNQVYPTGTYPNGGFYGSDVVAPIPGGEYTNPLFHGCIDHNA